MIGVMKIYLKKKQIKLWMNGIMVNVDEDGNKINPKNIYYSSSGFNKKVTGLNAYPIQNMDLS